LYRKTVLLCAFPEVVEFSRGRVTRITSPRPLELSQLWNLDAAALPYLKMASERGLGTAQFEKLRTRLITLDSAA
jgi:hypothetical protein